MISGYCASSSVVVTNPSLPATSFSCYETEACAISVGTYSMNHVCTLSYLVIDTATSAVSTLGFTLTESSNTVSLSLTAASGT